MQVDLLNVFNDLLDLNICINIRMKSRLECRTGHPLKKGGTSLQDMGVACRKPRPNLTFVTKETRFINSKVPKMIYHISFSQCLNLCHFC